MTAQEKAIELVNSFMDLSEEQEYNTPRYMSKEMAKQCALIAVDEIVKNGIYSFEDNRYWEQVKQEIQKI